jgi:hypothetical protein
LAWKIDSIEHDQQTVNAEFREQLIRDPEGWYETGGEEGSLRRLDCLYNKLEKMEVTREYNKVIEQQKEEGIVELADELPTSKGSFTFPTNLLCQQAHNRQSFVWCMMDLLEKTHNPLVSTSVCMPDLRSRTSCGTSWHECGFIQLHCRLAT